MNEEFCSWIFQKEEYIDFLLLVEYSEGCHSYDNIVGTKNETMEKRNNEEIIMHDAIYAPSITPHLTLNASHQCLHDVSWY